MASLFATPAAVTTTKKPAASLFGATPNNDTGSFGTQGVNPMAAPATTATGAPQSSSLTNFYQPNPALAGGMGPRTDVTGGIGLVTPADQARLAASQAAGTQPSRNPAPGAPAIGTAQQAASTSPLNYYMEQSLKGMANPQIAASNQLGQNAMAGGQRVAAQQNTTAAGFNQTGQNFNATTQNVGQAPGAGGLRAGPAGASGLFPTAGAFGGGAAPQPGFQLGTQVPTATATKAPAALSTGQLGAVPTINQIGNVAGQLGQTPQAAGVGGIAGQLNGAPQVGNVGNIVNGSAPGGITGALGQQGASNVDQQGMLGRLNGFLDAPEGPSIAEAQLKQAQAGNMADLIGAARSGRGGAGAQAQALRGAMSEGSAVMSDTAGQLATLRAQEQDMLKNRQLNAIGLGGDMATAQRGQDLGFRGQNLQGLQGDQSTALGARGQDIQSAMANQGTQTALEQLRAQTALGARGQNLSALQGDQGTAAQMSLGQLGADVTGRGQNLSALQGDQSTQLGQQGLAAQTALAGRGQDLSLLQGNQATALGARGQDVTNASNMANVNLGLRGQDANVLTADADRGLAGQRLNLDAGLGYGNLANEATGQGLNFLSNANQQGVMSQGLSNDMSQNLMNNYTSMNNAQVAADAGVNVANANHENDPTFGQSLAIAGLQSLPGLAGAAVGLSDERAKTDVRGLDAIKSSLDDHLRGAPGYSYRYKPGFGEDPDATRTGPMAQDLERGPFGKDLVKMGADGYRRVDTSRLSLVNHAALAGMRSELDKLKAQLEN